MDDEPLPQLRPIRLQGKAYYVALKAILKEEGPDILATMERWRAERGGITPAMIGALALKHGLNFKATCEFLEDERVLKCGIYDRITEQHRPTAVLKAGREWLRARDGDDKTAVQVAFERASTQ